MQALARGESSVNEWRREVEAPSGHPQHSFNKIMNLLVGKYRGRQLGFSAARYEYFSWLVDPDFLDRRVIKISLKGTETSDGVKKELGDLLGVPDRRDEPVERAPVIIGNRFCDEAPHLCHVVARIDSTPTDKLADFAFEHRCRLLHRQLLHNSPNGAAHREWLPRPRARCPAALVLR